MRLLYVEDDPTAREYVRRGLEDHGCAVEPVAGSEEGLERALGGSYDLILLDVMLPGDDGFTLLHRLREAGVDTPVLFLSARGEVADRIRGLELGGDDYLPKPFAFAELLARVRALTRRRRGGPREAALRVADLALDLHRRSVARAGRSIELTPKEFALLEYLMLHEGQAVSRSMVIESVWGWGFESYSNLIDVHINRLRKKLDRDFPVKLIHTVKGFGYVLEDRGREASSAGGGQCA